MLGYQKNKNRALFTTQLGLLAAATGSAIGLGNIWRFPSVTAANGGAIFLLIYIVCVLFFGIPLLIAEFIIGRASHSNAYRAYSVLSSQREIWKYAGAFSILATLFIMGYYFVVGGWTMQYFFDSVTANLFQSDDFGLKFDLLATNPVQQLFLAGTMILFTAFFVYSGIRHGIEHSAKVLMPSLFLLLILLAIRSLTLDGALHGLEYFIAPSCEHVRPGTFLEAIGQVLFSLSLGGGIMVTYASYFQSQTDLVRTSVWVAILDTLVAVLAGLIIFPTAFALSTDPPEVLQQALLNGGSGLTFKTIPALFQRMPIPSFWGALFFAFLAIAALTTAISYMEVVTVFLQEEWHISRAYATYFVVGMVLFLATACSFSQEIFTNLDILVAKIMLPISSFFVSLFVGWRLKKALFYEQLQNPDVRWKISTRVLTFYRKILQYVAPVLILLVFLYGILFPQV